MASSGLSADELQAVLTKSVEANALPGATVAVLYDGEVATAAAGVINLRTGVETTTDTLFQIGSATKMYTATLVMMLVDAGSIDLDAPVVRYLPDFRVADERATATISVRQLLTHTAGFDGGDWFFEAGPGDDALQRYVASLSGLRQIARQGEYWSYNNSGFGVLGRVIEVVTGQTWDDAMRDLLLKPAGLNHTVSRAEDALLFRTAAGHQMGAEGPELVSRWGMDRSVGPMGALCADAEDVIAFGRIHLEDGQGLLSAASVKAMQEPQVPFPGDPTGWCGLGWAIHDQDGVRWVGHGGDTPGQHALFDLVPERGLAVAILTNGPTGRVVQAEVMEHITTALGLPSRKEALPKLPDAPPVVDLSNYVGRYERNSVHQIITIDDDKLLLTVEYVDIPFDLSPPPPMFLAPITPEQFAVLAPDGSVAMTMEFLEFDDDHRPQLSFLGRLAARA